ncbi:hypothetical protein [Streptomyces fradiae]|uniref:hypothetical protein n=1 Tax=Streptomyces fradiae TaxID=1906 RepID=UPI002942AB52|nr:hypothetical protein [Streptomyces fradiae]WOI62754.1 hypothetical protein RYQ63_24260 [Streptomyces fradiae]
MRRAGQAAVGLGLLLSLAAAGCSGADGGGGVGGGDKGRSAAPSTRMHVLTRTPCALLEAKPLVDGMTFRAGTDSLRTEPREDSSQDGTPETYRQVSCHETNGRAAQGGDLWLLSTSADVYERVGPACHRKRVKEDLDRAQHLGPVALGDSAYWRSIEENGRPGRELVLCDGNLLLEVTAFAPYGSERGSVDGTLGKVVEAAARLMEEGLRDPSAPSSTPAP